MYTNKITYSFIGLLIISCMIVGKYLYEPNNTKYHELSSLMLDITVGLGNPDASSKRTTGLGVLFLEYEFFNADRSMVDQVVSNIDSVGYWKLFIPPKEDSIDILKSYCYNAKLLTLSQYNNKLIISISENDRICDKEL